MKTNLKNIEDFKTTEDIRKCLLKNYSMVTIDEHKELKSLYDFVQHNRGKDIIVVKGDAEMYHYWMKWCNLYTIKQMINMLCCKKLDTVCTGLLQKLRKEDAKGRTRLITFSDRIHNLIRKYL